MPRLTLPTLYLGIDPGGSGGIATVNESGECISSVSMPKTRQDTLNCLPNAILRVGKVRAIVEEVHALPQNAVRAAFKFGMNYERVCMALQAVGISFEEVPPTVWLRGLGIPPRKKTETKTQWKNRLKQKAQQMFPSVNVTLSTADALLIAEYCRRKHRGLL